MSISSFRFGALGISGSARAVRAIIWLITAMAPIYLLSELTPLLDREAVMQSVYADSSYKKVKEDALIKVHQGEKLPVLFTKQVSSLVEANASLLVYGAEKLPEIVDESVRVHLRVDRLVLYVGMLAISVLTLIFILREVTQIKVGSISMTLPESLQTPSLEEADDDSTKQSLTPVTILQAEVVRARARADDIFTRSTLQLAGGIILTFVGVAIFYITLPETGTNETLESYLPKAIRPTGVLIFVEAIAWFLLRQYRALIEDYKWFHRHYTKRANYLAALQILQGDTVKPEHLFLAITLLNEDLSGRLKTGESTEALETLKLNDESPISEILKVVGRFRERAGEKSKDAAQKTNDG